MWPFCHSVNRITDKRGNGCRPNLAGGTLGRGDPLEVIRFWWWSGSACGFRTTFHSFSSLRNMGFLGHLLAFLIQSTADLYHTRHPQYFETDTTDIQIQINPKIQKQIPDHLFQILALAGLCSLSALVMPPPIGRGQVSIAFLCPSVRPSVAYIPNNLRTRRPSVSKFRMKVPHLWCDSHTSFKVKRWKVKVTRVINADHWLSCDADTSAAYLPTATYCITLAGIF